ncbi:hypothetical protein [Crateriforma conspicua]|uniref:SMP-30/Gluconolaconase/LRE-like region n=1 Tax=Crateriforma conspicua TaxID=2527996 RepID=A0A5C6FHW5_9PLAN|nr:hypothetical protein [Crateriforma conspicua]TWU61835.1 hypothetical protein V7x_35240 [Crateriforma conspicua]
MFSRLTSFLRPSCMVVVAGLAGSLGNSVNAETSVQTVLRGLVNPSSVSFSPEGELTVCDARGIVVVLKDNKPTNYITGFDTEHWKSNDEGQKWYAVGPLSAVWSGSTLIVTDAGKADGEETLLFFDEKGKAESGTATNAVPPTSDDPADKGEGNLTGMSLSKDGTTAYVCGQGFDGKSWVLSADIASKELTPLLSADENGIETNSPMQTVVADDNTLYVLYSGKGGEADGLIVKWDLTTQKPTDQWSLPGVINPMGLAHISGNKFAVAENNWSLNQTNSGRILIATLGEDDDAEVKETGVVLSGPVACTFGPDNRLYVSQLGEEFDKPVGSVVAIDGLKD